MFSPFPPNDVDPNDTVLDFRAVFGSEPRLIGRYQIGRELGRGRLGPTFDAWHVDRRRHVALKKLTVDADPANRLAAERTLLKRLEIIGRLSHPALVPVQDIGLIDDGLFVAVDSLPGTTLESALADGWTPTPTQAVRLLRILADALFTVHGAGFVHGNLHAGQVMLVNEVTPVLTDVGLTAAARGLARVDEVSARLCDRACMAPELRAFGKCRPATDMYALGVLSIRLLVGEQRFLEMAHAQLHTSESGGLWTPIDQVRPELPPALCVWITSAVDPEPRNRPQAAEGLPVNLDFARLHGADQTPSRVAQALARPHARRRWMVAGAVASSVAMAGLLQSKPVPVTLEPDPAPALGTAATVPATASYDAVLQARPPAAGPQPVRAAAGPAPIRLKLDR